ncbi:hypothetical protein BDV93DRAFT_562405 [Ceratobasidium sp. AG-I]|nr:hypothetical protein BDV93DRAFT_562405 [Ceratobasidium sp. AG-I]
MVSLSISILTLLAKDENAWSYLVGEGAFTALFDTLKSGDAYMVTIASLIWDADSRAELLRAEIISFLCSCLISKTTHLAHEALFAVEKIATYEGLRAAMVTTDLLLSLSALLLHKNDIALNVVMGLVMQDDSRAELVNKGMMQYLLQALRDPSIHILYAIAELSRYEDTRAELLKKKIVLRLSFPLKSGNIALVREALYIIDVLATHAPSEITLGDTALLSSLTNLVKTKNPMGSRVIALLATHGNKMPEDFIPLVVPFLREYGADTVLAVERLLADDLIQAKLLNEGIVPVLHHLIHQDDAALTYGALRAIMPIATNHESQHSLIHDGLLESLVQFLKNTEFRHVETLTDISARIFEITTDIILTLSSNDKARDQLLNLDVTGVLARLLTSDDTFKDCETACLKVTAELAQHSDSCALLISAGVVPIICSKWDDFNTALVQTLWPTAMWMVERGNERIQLRQHGLAACVVDYLTPDPWSFIAWRKALPQTLNLFDKLVEYEDTRTLLVTKEVASKLETLLEHLSLWCYRLSLLSNGQPYFDSIRHPILVSIAKLVEHEDTRDWFLKLKCFESLRAGDRDQLQGADVDACVTMLSQVIPELKGTLNDKPHLR